MEINDPAVVVEVAAGLTRYEKALTGNDVAVLDELFWDSPHVLRYGAGENLYGYAAIAAFRAARPTQDLAREVLKTVITTFGRDFATASLEFRRGDRAGRQSQTWVARPKGGASSPRM